MLFLNHRRIYRNRQTGQCSTWLYDVLPKKLTVEDSYQVKVYLRTYNTLFSEIEVVPWEETLSAAERELMQTPARVTKENYAEFGKHVAQVLEAVVEETWSPTKFHVVAHSSGEDSRLLSATIRKIYGRRGPSWLGNLLFYCAEWEYPTFLEVMRYEGWEPRHQAVYRKSVDPSYYWEEALDFKNVWKALNGPRGFIRNVYYYPIRAAQRAGVLPEDSDDIQLLTMRGVMLPAKLKSVGPLPKMAERWYSRCQESIIPEGVADVLFLPLSYDIIRTIIASTHTEGMHWPDVALASLDPELLKFPNLNVGKNAFKEHAHRRIADKLFDKAKDDYRNSWYGQNVCPEALEIATPYERYFAWWSRWNAAAICEHLLEEGYDLSVIRRARRRRRRRRPS